MDVSTTIVAGVPAGSVLDFAGSSAPSGYLICDGSLVSRTTYARLYDSIGTAWGVGDGSTTFKLPDLRGRVTLGVGTGSSLTARTLAAIGGTETHTLTTSEMPSHTHTQDSHNHTQNAHTHSATAYTTSGVNGVALQAFSNAHAPSAVVTNTVNSTTPTNNATTATNQTTGGDGAHNNMQPFAVLNKIIKF